MAGVRGLAATAALAFGLSLPAGDGRADDINVPMWEGVIKTAIQLDADKKFIDDVRSATGGNMELGVRRAIQLGWHYIALNDPNTALKRFNQAWLIDPKCPDAYWGFAVAMAQKAAPLPTVERLFAMAERLKPDDPSLLSDHGRVLQQRGENERAVTYFLKALEINKDHRDAHVGMMFASMAMGQMLLADKHRRIAASLSGGGPVITIPDPASLEPAR
ncbi:tetratricopeptide repeat protein [Ensifer sp. MJa1]|uniref:tetratricopeptide repeat protein n=1 Tax=Ensifer sp. MJa1 TaxID=2919888 RepID=UPI00300A98C2